eukprot:TRINITY_DN29700_c0_g1_i1.p1 TRINITY_DN29700_c0_g1~~TRINITY_DN29700_c0_g1_i1.p1  ORF type:complete len:1107 (-),score=217.93 TRINITY_DN29700_c0_g1_i1:310-3573(-)
MTKKKVKRDPNKPRKQAAPIAASKPKGFKFKRSSEGKVKLVFSPKGRVVNDAPPWLQAFQTTRPWLQWTEEDGLTCLACVEANNGCNFCSGVKASTAWWKQNPHLVTRHDGTHPDVNYKGAKHRKAVTIWMEKRAKMTAGSGEPGQLAADGTEPMHCSLDRQQVKTWMTGLYWCAAQRLSIEQTMAYQEHQASKKGQGLDMLETHHSPYAIKEGWRALFQTRMSDLQVDLRNARVWASMLDGQTDQTKVYAGCVKYVDKTGALVTDCSDLHEFDGRLDLSWSDEEEGEGADQGADEDQHGYSQDAAQPGDEDEFEEGPFQKANDHLENYLHRKFPMQSQVWQCLDGEAANLGSRTGLGIRLQRRNKHLVVYHCVNHRQQLGHASASRESMGISRKEYMSNEDRTIKYLDKNPKFERHAMQRSIKIAETRKGLKNCKKSDTRWLFQHKRTNNFRRSLKSRLDTFKAYLKSKVPTAMKRKMRLLYNQNRRFSTLFWCHFLSDYVQIGWNTMSRLQHRLVPLGAPQRELEISRQKAAEMCPNLDSESGPVLGGAHFCDFVQEITRTGGGKWHGHDVLYVTEDEMSLCLDEARKYVIKDQQAQQFRMKEGCDVAAALKKLLLHEAFFGMTLEGSRYFRKELEGIIKEKFHGLPCGGADGFILDCDQAAAELDNFLVLYKNAIKESFHDVTVQKALMTNLAEVYVMQEVILTKLQVLARLQVPHMATILEIARVAVISQSAVESIFSVVKCLKGDRRHSASTELLAFGVVMCTGPSERDALSSGLIDRAVDLFLNKKARRSYRQQKLGSYILVSLSDKAAAVADRLHEAEKWPEKHTADAAAVELARVAAANAASNRSKDTFKDAEYAMATAWWDLQSEVAAKQGVPSAALKEGVKKHAVKGVVKKAGSSHNAGMIPAKKVEATLADETESTSSVKHSSKAAASSSSASAKGPVQLASDSSSTAQTAHAKLERPAISAPELTTEPKFRRALEGVLKYLADAKITPDSALEDKLYGKVVMWWSDNVWRRQKASTQSKTEKQKWLRSQLLELRDCSTAQADSFFTAAFKQIRKADDRFLAVPEASKSSKSSKSK